MSRRRTAVLSVLLACAGGLARAEELSCSRYEKLKDGFSRELDLKLTLDHDRVIAIEHSNSNSSGEEGGAYFCNLETSTKDPDATWKEDKGKVVVQMSQSRSTLTITKTTDGYLVDYEEMTRDNCGFGASFPKTVRIVRGKKTCVVEIPKY